MSEVKKVSALIFLFWLLSLGSGEAYAENSKAAENGMTLFAGPGPAAAPFLGAGVSLSYFNREKHHGGLDVSVGLQQSLFGFDGRIHYAYGMNHRAIGGLAYFRARVQSYETNYIALNTEKKIQQTYNRYLPGFFGGYEFVSDGGFCARVMVTFSYNRVEYLIAPEDGFFSAWNMTYWFTAGYKVF